MTSSDSPTSRSKDEKLWVACQGGRVDDVRRLVGEGADVNFCNYGNNCETCLLVACKNERTDIVSELLKAGADLDKVDDDGMTPLIISVKLGNCKIVDMLIHSDCDMNVTDCIYRAKAIHYAVNFLPILKSLISAGADIEAMDKRARRPLHWACFDGRVEAVSYLVQAGADTEAWDCDGQDAMNHATDGSTSVDEVTKARVVAILDGARAK